MSFWDSIKPAKRVAVPTSVSVAADQRAITISWDDGHVATVTAQRLRQSCPCAGCVEELTGVRTLDLATVPADLKVLEAHPVGNYALTFVFGDAHRTGIFNWATLRQLG